MLTKNTVNNLYSCKHQYLPKSTRFKNVMSFIERGFAFCQRHSFRKLKENTDKQNRQMDGMSKKKLTGKNCDGTVDPG